RQPRISVPGSANTDPGSAIEIGTRASGPATTDSISATSLAVRPSVPGTDRASDSHRDGYSGTRPRDGRSPNTPVPDAEVGADPGRFDAVFDRHGQSVKRADPFAVRGPSLRRLGLAARRLERGCDDRVDRRIELFVRRFR